MKLGSGQCLRIVERIRLQPGDMGDGELGAEALLEEASEGFVLPVLGFHPGIEGDDIVEMVLAGEGLLLLALDRGRREQRVGFGAFGIPLRRLVPAPGGEDGDRCEDHCFEDLDPRVPAHGRGVAPVAPLVEDLRDLDIGGGLGHRISWCRSPADDSRETPARRGLHRAQPERAAASAKREGSRAEARAKPQIQGALPRPRATAAEPLPGACPVEGDRDAGPPHWGGFIVVSRRYPRQTSPGSTIRARRCCVRVASLFKHLSTKGSR